MKKILVAVAVVSLLSGCSNLKLYPNENLETAKVDKLESATALLIIDKDFQEYVHTGKPTEGKLWGIRTFDIYIGKSLTSSVQNQVKDLIRKTEFSERLISGNYDVTVRLKSVKVEFGAADDGEVHGKMALFGPLGGAFADVVTRARLTMSAEIWSGNSSPSTVDIIGVGSHVTGFYSLRETTLTKDIEIAVMDLSKKLAIKIADTVLDKKKTS